jgi:hypothetical protein
MISSDNLLNCHYRYLLFFTTLDLRTGPGLYRINRRLPFFVSAGVMGVCALALLRVKPLSDDAADDRDGQSRAESSVDDVQGAAHGNQSALMDKAADADSTTVFVRNGSDAASPSATVPLMRSVH